MPTETEQLEALLPLCRHVARRHSGDDLDDLTQVAAIGALKAIRTFDPARGVPLVGYAAACADFEIRHHVRDRGSLVRVPRREYEAGDRALVVSLNRPVQTAADDGDGLELGDVLAADGDAYAEAHALDAIRRLPRREATAVLAGLLGVAQVVIARKLGCAQITASRLQRAGHEALRDVA